jgi:hypothetical protein
MLRLPFFRAAVGLLCCHLVAGGTGLIAARQVPPPATQPAEDPRRLQDEAKLKDLQRQENETQDLRRKERLLGEIIDLCITLGRDYASYQARLEAVKQQLAQAQQAREAEEQKARAAQQKIGENRQLQDRALGALAGGDLVAAGRAVEAALKLSPNDPQTLRLQQRIADMGRQRLIRRVALGSLVGIAALGALFGLMKSVRKGGRVRQLEVVEGPQAGEVFRLDRETTSLGALASEADIVIADPYRKISRRHCDIARNGRHYFLVDCSTNGTYINGAQVPRGEPVLLRKGDTIGLAEDVALRFR